ARATLVHVLDQTLRTLHPVMPFITEEIWEKLPLGDRRASELLATSSYPVDLSEFSDPELEREYAVVQALITGIRSIRTETQVGFKPKLDATVASPTMRQAIEKHRHEIKSLTNLASLTLADRVAEPPKGCAVKVHELFELHVPLEGLVDFGKERERLSKQRAKTEVELGKLEGKLSNERFVKNAPADVVQKDRDRLAELGTMLTKLDESLANLPD
ncbi:MAG: class I tRNA ligase family protein, partial [Myxococcota bacterium]